MILKGKSTAHIIVRDIFQNQKDLLSFKTIKSIKVKVVHRICAKPYFQYTLLLQILFGLTVPLRSVTALATSHELYRL